LLCGIRVSATALQQDGSFVIIQFGRRFQGSVQLPEDLLCMRDPLMVRILVQKSSVGKSANEKKGAQRRPESQCELVPKGHAARPVWLIMIHAKGLS
jgi:hypothetical protein